MPPAAPPASAAASPPDSGLARITPRNEPALEAAISDALETGQPSRWNSESGGYSGRVTVGPSREDDEKTCRSYRYTVRRGAAEWSSGASMVCRDADGTWLRGR